MKNLALRYVQDLCAAFSATPGLTAVVESSPARAVSLDAPQVLLVQLGAESIEGVAPPRVTRQREIQLIVHTRGDDHLALTEQVFEQAHPVIMAYADPNIVMVAEFGTDDAKYANGDLRRQVVTKRYRITYQTDENALGYPA